MLIGDRRGVASPAGLFAGRQTLRKSERRELLLLAPLGASASARVRPRRPAPCTRKRLGAAGPPHAGLAQHETRARARARVPTAPLRLARADAPPAQVTLTVVAQRAVAIMLPIAACGWRRKRRDDAVQRLRLSLLLLVCVAAQPPATLAVDREEARPAQRQLLQGALSLMCTEHAACPPHALTPHAACLLLRQPQARRCRFPRRSSRGAPR